jgi:hypothetical protein
MRAQRDLTTRVRNDSLTSIERDGTLQVKRNLKLMVDEGSYDTAVAKGAYHIQVDQGEMGTKVPEGAYLLDAKSITETANASIMLQVHGCWLKIDQHGIELVGPIGSIRLDKEGIFLSTPTSTVKLENDLGVTISGPQVNVG